AVVEGTTSRIAGSAHRQSARAWIELRREGRTRQHLAVARLIADRDSVDACVDHCGTGLAIHPFRADVLDPANPAAGQHPAADVLERRIGEVSSAYVDAADPRLRDGRLRAA